MFSRSSLRFSRRVLLLTRTFFHRNLHLDCSLESLPLLDVLDLSCPNDPMTAARASSPSIHFRYGAGALAWNVLQFEAVWSRALGQSIRAMLQDRDASVVEDTLLKWVQSADDETTTTRTMRFTLLCLAAKHGCDGTNRLIMRIVTQLFVHHQFYTLNHGHSYTMLSCLCALGMHDATNEETVMELIVSLVEVQLERIGSAEDFLPAQPLVDATLAIAHAYDQLKPNAPLHKVLGDLTRRLLQTSSQQLSSTANNKEHHRSKTTEIVSAVSPYPLFFACLIPSFMERRDSRFCLQYFWRSKETSFFVHSPK